MKQDLIAFAKLTFAAIGYTAIAAIAFYCGRAHMHKTLTDDMKRNNDAGIPAVTSAGKFYLYTQDTTYIEWERTQNAN